jgi:hypothetical protein
MFLKGTRRKHSGAVILHPWLENIYIGILNV